MVMVVSSLGPGRCAGVPAVDGILHPVELCSIFLRDLLVVDGINAYMGTAVKAVVALKAPVDPGRADGYERLAASPRGAGARTACAE
jgi:hypothetical protein